MSLKNVRQTTFLTSRYEIIDPTFGRSNSPVELDLGCGRGSFSIGLARRHPQSVVLAVDVKTARLQTINNKAAVHKLTNVHTIKALAWDLIAWFLPSECLNRVHILCPDPWPKKKHRTHKLITSEFLGRLARVMKDKAVLHLATDDPTYFAWMQSAVQPLRFFVPFDEGIADVRDIRTDFEAHYLSMGKPVGHLSLRFEKNNFP